MSRTSLGLLAAVAIAAGTTTFTAAAGAAPLFGPQTPTGSTPPGGACAVADDPYGGAGDLFALTTDARLVRLGGTGFQPERTVSIGGLPAGVALVGLDTRPANGQLYSIGTDARVYVVDPGTGTATAVSAAGGELPDADYGLDFNPTVDRLRVVDGNGDNLRVDPTLGTLAATDTQLSYRPGDVNAGRAPRVTAAAYTNSVVGAASTALYGIDTDTDSLVLQGTATESPNGGRLSTVGRLGIAIDGVNGFDIVGSTAYAAVMQTGRTRSTLVRIDLGTGRATLVGALPVGVVGLTGSAGAPLMAYATTDTGALFSFNRQVPGQATTPLGIAGLQPGEQIVGLDVRPATGQLYALGSTNRLYVVNPFTAVATQLGGQLEFPFGDAVGFDFNPTVDRIRVVTSSGRNLRVNPNDGSLTATDGDLSGPVSGAAYTNNRVGGGTTTLYDLNTDADTLVIQAPPNAGTLSTVGPLRVDASAVNGFDIAADGAAVAALQVGSAPSALYCVDLSTGRATLAARIGPGLRVTALAVAPRGVPYQRN